MKTVQREITPEQYEIKVVESLIFTQSKREGTRYCTHNEIIKLFKCFTQLEKNV